MPRGFPLIEGAIAVPNPDGDAIAAWRVNSVGSAAFDFYTRALRRAGFIVLGEFPSERSAMIRFQAPDGPILQVVAELSNGETLLTLRPDRP